MKPPPLVDPGAQLSAEELLRYSRHTLLPEMALAGQQRLKNAKVVCVGAGGLGSPILMYLAAAGVGVLGIVEFDTVDVSNLQRQIIHGQGDIGSSKAQSAQAKIAEINPYTNVITHEVRLDNSNVLEIFSNYDLVIDGTDNFETRYLINDACVLLGKPNIWGSIYRFEGQASVFWSEYGPCYRCLHPEPARGLSNCAQGGVLGVLCASIASIQATEAIKLITGIGTPLLGSLMIFDGLEMNYRRVDILKDPQCALCGVDPVQTSLLADYDEFCGSIPQSEITVIELKEKIDRGDRFILIDVREPHEFEIVRIPGSHLIPLANFTDGSALATLPRDRPIILHCRSGVRSATALAILKEAGFSDATHVRGGVIAWAEQIDTTCAVY